MYVNKGIGVSNFPVRFFARPEITLFTLQNSAQITNVSKNSGLKADTGMPADEYL
jgi:hypothetical protein